MDEEGPAEQRHQEEEADGEPALSGGTQQVVAGLTKNKQHRDERQRNEPFPGGRRAGPSGDDSHGGQDEDQGDSGGEDPVPRIMSCVHGGISDGAHRAGSSRLLNCLIHVTMVVSLEESQQC